MPTIPFSSTVETAFINISDNRDVVSWDLVKEILRLHPEYGNGIGEKLKNVGGAAGLGKPKSLWREEISNMFDPAEVDQIHGRLAILAIGRIDKKLNSFMKRNGLLGALERELKVNISSLLRRPMNDESELAKRRVHALSVDARDELLNARGLRNRGILGFIHHSQTNDSLPLRTIEMVSPEDFLYVIDTTDERISTRRNARELGSVGFVYRTQRDQTIQLHRFLSKEGEHIFVTNPNYEILRKEGFKEEKGHPMFIHNRKERATTILYLYSTMSGPFFIPLVDANENENSIATDTAKNETRSEGVSESQPMSTSAGDDDIQEPVPDIFMLYSQYEERVIRSINEEVLSWNFRTYFWESDVKYGTEWIKKEAKFLQEVKIILVFLGEHGWGPTHLKLAEEALRLGKRIVPVLIGKPPYDAFLLANRLFQERRYVDLSVIDPASLNELKKAITLPGNDEQLQNEDTGGFDALINRLIDGNEDQRSEILSQIRSGNYNRDGLAVRLREEISRFSSAAEDNQSVAPRPVDRIPSIRSWLLSCLIHTDAENPENRKLLIRHVDPAFEPRDHVRYWVLAGLYQWQVSYLMEAAKVAMQASGSYVVALAKGIVSPMDEAIVKDLRRALSSSEFRPAWQALRVLRVLPIITLAEDICELVRSMADDNNLVYDAFYALSNPAIVETAAKSLMENPGTTIVVERLVLILAESNNATRNNLTRLLFYFARATVSEALEKIIARGKYALVAIHMREILKRFYQEKENVREVSRAGFYGDFIDPTKDWLNIEQDVKTLTAVMLAKNTQLPLAIGLFADWGHGKSFFMASIRQEIRDAKKNYNSAVFCTDVVPIEFNAWHYADTNLWASLVNHILVQLLKFIAPEATDEEKQQAILNQISSTKSQAVVAREKQKAVLNTISTKEKELSTAKKQREDKEIELREIKQKDIYDVLTDEQKKEVRKAADTLGVPAIINSFSDLQTLYAQASSVTGKTHSLIKSILQSRNRNLLIAMLISVLIVVPILVEIINREGSSGNAFMVKIGAIVAKFVAFIGIVTPILKKALYKMNAGISTIEAIKNNAELKFEEKRMTLSEDEIRVSEEIEQLKIQESQAAEVITSKEKELEILEEKIRLLKEERSLNRFLTTRTQSEDYRKHLGIISVIREDFTSLTTKLANAHKEPNSSFRRIDRIVLYIDDLDRCPTDKVMDVLQAVHLLLAFPLFVVVVGVDPRWLLHSLGSTFSAFQNEGKNFGLDKKTSEWLTTPQHFLEKIFQIQFCLSPMTPEGYATMIGNLFKNTEVGEHHEDNNNQQNSENTSNARTAETTKEAEGQGVETAKSKEIEMPNAIGLNRMEQMVAEKNTDVLQAELSPVKQGIDDPNQVPPKQHQNLTQGDKGNGNRQQQNANAANNGKYRIDEESLVITEWEIKFASDLHEFVTSPRAATRFSNAYRLLKASISKADLSAFEGQRELLGDFQVPMLLLALISGSSNESVLFFPELQKKLGIEKTIVSAIDSILGSQKESDDSYARFVAKIKRVVNGKNFPQNNELFAIWIPRVARFSFNLSRNLKLERQQEK
jgi:hypothetical protein